MSDWRKLGNLTLAQFEGELRAYNSPILAESKAVREALLPHSIFACAILFHEKKFDTYNQVIPQSFHNPFAWSSGWSNGGHTWHQFPNYTTAAREWLKWVLSSESPFANTRTVAEFIHVYAPSSDGNDEQRYVDVIEKYAKKYGGSTVPDVPATEYKFGNCKVPNYDTKIVVKPWVGAGYDVVPPRNNVGMCMHQWWGYGDKYSLYRLFSTGGERQADALVDWSLTQEGELVMLNEPWKTRAGWANGGSDGLEGYGTLFVRTLGVGAINGRLVSCEFEGKGDPLTDAQMDIGSSLWAYYFDSFRVPWDSYPLNPAVGCVTDLDHYEFATKDCPFSGARNQRHVFQSLVKGKLKAGQTGTDSGPVDPNPQPDHSWLPKGLTVEIVRELFGTGEKHNPDGTTASFAFDEKGLISNAWLAEGTKTNQYPAALDWWRINDSNNQVVRNIVTFSNGRLLQGNDGDRASWSWR